MLDMMKGGILGQANAAKEMAPCKPDPEEMLQHARSRKGKILLDIAAFESIDSYYMPDSERYALMFFGALQLALREAEQTEQYWLNEIDKD